MIHTKNYMNKFNVKQLSELLDKWSEVALASGWVEDWVEGAIFPCEMVFFLAHCEQSDIKCIIESGRQDGYSTKILGEYASRKGARIYSIDYEEDYERAQKCLKRLTLYPEVNLLKGDANILLGKLVSVNNIGNLAILMDGPKGFWAMSLIFANSGYRWVKLLALHNLVENETAKNFFQSYSDEAVFYEDFSINSNGPWIKLRNTEIGFCAQREAKRSLYKSSLGVMRIPDRGHFRLVSAYHKKFRLFQPLLVHCGWRLGLYHLTAYLYSISFRFSGTASKFISLLSAIYKNKK